MITAPDLLVAARHGVGDVMSALGKDHPDGERLDTLAKSAGLMVLGRFAMIAFGLIGSLGIPALVAVIWNLNILVTQHSTDLTDLKTSFSERKVFGDSERAQIVGRLDALGSRISSLAQDAAAAATAATGVQRQLDANHTDSKEQVTQIQAEITQVQAQVNGINEKLGPIIFDLSRVKAQVLCKGRPEC